MSVPATIYLDHAATSPMDPHVLESMLPYLDAGYGNPSSLHRWGTAARNALEAARATVAECLGAVSPEEILFTSGGTEADNLAILGVARALRDRGRHIIASSVEHPAVLEPCRLLAAEGWEVTLLPVDREGFVSPDALERALRPDTVLVSIMHGNNEIGTIQPIEAIARLLAERGVAFHTDAVQTAGKLPLDLRRLPVDYVSVSAHKLYGPKGAGALYIRSGAVLPVPLVVGGGQERDIRSGTQNVAGAVGFAEALRRCVACRESESDRLRILQAWLIEQVEAGLPEAVLNGPRDLERRVPGNVNFSFPPIQGESLVLHLDLKGVAVSSGSACHSASLNPSHVVLATGQSPEVAQSTVRFSMGRSTTREDLARVAALLPGIIHRLSNAPAV